VIFLVSRKFLFWFVFTANLVGAIYGFIFYYGNQFAVTNPLLWFFVPDCPLMSLFFAFSMILIRFKKNFHAFYFLSFSGSLKYGFWTVFVLTNFSAFYFTPSLSLLYTVLFISHVFLFIEQFTLIGKIKLKKLFLVLALIFLIANDFSDYFLFTHPPLPRNSLGFMFNATLLMTFAFTFFSYWVLKNFKNPLIKIFNF
jgi:uncharacterized membrane protein YpjA